MTEVTFISPFDEYLKKITNAQRVYAVHQLKKLEHQLRDHGMADAATMTRSFAGEIVGDTMVSLLELQEKLERDGVK